MISVVVNDVEARELLQELAERTKNLKPVFEKDVLELLFLYFDRRFSSGGRYGGGSWARLRPATIELREKMQKPARAGIDAILMNTLALRSSLTQRGAPYQVLKITESSMEFGTDAPGAKYQQEGWVLRNVYNRPVTPRKVRPRKLIAETLPAPWMAKLAKAIARHIEGD